MKVISLLFGVIVLVVVVGLGHVFGRTQYAGQYDNVPDNVRSWFKDIRSPHGVPCCDEADGHRTDYDIRNDNHYWVPIEGEWRQVPSESVIRNAGNPTGEAVVWYVKQNTDTIYIRCFVPGGGV